MKICIIIVIRTQANNSKAPQTKYYLFLKQMQNIIQNPQTFKIFSNCSAAIQILICLILLVVLIKQSVNFYNKNYTSYMVIKQTEYKYQQNTQMMFENNPNLVSKSQSRKPQTTLQNSPKQQIPSMKNSKAPLKKYQNNLQKVGQQKIEQKNKQVIPKSLIKSEMSIKQQRQASAETKEQKFKTKSFNFIVNLSIERLLIKLTFFGIMVINIVLNTSFQFLAIIAYLYIACVVVGELVKDKWWKIGFIMEVASAGCIIAAFISAYTSQRPTL